MHISLSRPIPPALIPAIKLNIFSFCLALDAAPAGLALDKHDSLLRQDEQQLDKHVDDRDAHQIRCGNKDAMREAFFDADDENDG